MRYEVLFLPSVSMAPNCSSCALHLNLREANVICCCYCEAAFHFRCVIVREELLREIMTHIELHWSCPGCCNVKINPRTKPQKQIGMQVGFQAALTAAVETMKAAVVEPLIKQMRAGFTMLQSSNTLCSSRPQSLRGK